MLLDSILASVPKANNFFMSFIGRFLCNIIVGFFRSPFGASSAYGALISSGSRAGRFCPEATALDLTLADPNPCIRRGASRRKMAASIFCPQEMLIKALARRCILHDGDEGGCGSVRQSLNFLIVARTKAQAAETLETAPQSRWPLSGVRGDWNKPHHAEYRTFGSVSFAHR